MDLVLRGAGPEGLLRGAMRAHAGRRRKRHALDLVGRLDRALVVERPRDGGRIVVAESFRRERGLAQDRPPGLAGDPPEFKGVSDLDNWPMRDLVTGHVMVKEIACNWKIFWENYNECLHCPGIHPELSDMVPVYGRGYMAANEAPDWTPGTPLPAHQLKDGAGTWSMTGALCGPPFPGLTQEQLAAGSHFVTLLPTAVTTPAISCPGTSGYTLMPQPLSTMWMSE